MREIEEIKDDSQISSLSKWVDSGSGLPCTGAQVVDSGQVRQCRRRSKFGGKSLITHTTVTNT